MNYLTKISIKSTQLVLLTVLFLVCAHVAKAIEKRALIVGLGNYGPDTEWLKTHGDHDANIMAKEIKSIGFNHYKKLLNNQATKKNILGELNALYDSCKQGDIVLFYFAGHGQLILDYNAEEQDGYDESLVLYNAPKSFDAVYNNEAHLLDDEISEIVNRFRIKLGSEGQFILIVDAGFGWSNAEGNNQFERGGALPLEANLETHSFEKIGLYETGIIDDLPFSIPSDGYANLFHVSANQIRGTAQELNGNGVLTLAITRSFEELNDSTDYEKWFNSIESFSLKMLPNQTPIAEGNGSTVVFDLYNRTEGSDYKTNYAIQDTTKTLSDEEIKILSDLKDQLIEEHNNDIGNPDFGVF